jgi:hypothetical protein
VALTSLLGHFVMAGQQQHNATTFKANPSSEVSYKANLRKISTKK